MSKTVLLVDDAPFIRKMLGDILKKDGYEIVGEAKNGIEAVELYQELNPDIVTMDITMPLKGGIEALEEILEIDENATVVMCSAMGQDTYSKKAYEIGAKEFIIKPFKPDAVLKVFSTLEV
ncbi:response regulator [Bacillus sp. Brlt_9]|uniref:response regulator n=1 Tax=Bacillus sp. Brlt_9 TaxID=3110916 RepID=UPI003F7B4AF3